MVGGALILFVTPLPAAGQIAQAEKTQAGIVRPPFYFE
jgi:hypothetical protein